MQSQKNSSRFFSHMVGVCLLALTLTGCARPEVRLLWPPPPLTPQLEYIGSYRSELDLSKKHGIQQLDIFSSFDAAEFFIGPYGIAVDSEGRAMVSDIAQRNLRRFDFDKETVDYVGGSGEFALPSDLCFDSRDQLYVVDGLKSRVSIFNPDLSWKSLFSTKGELTRPVYLALNEALDRLYISDAVGDRIGVYSTAGKPLFTFGSAGRKPGLFNNPQGIAIDKSGRVFVVDMLNARIQVFGPDGTFLYQFGQRGENLWDFEWPKDLAFDSAGNLYILDQRKAILTIREPNGNPILALGEAPTRHELGFASPVGIAIDKQDRIYITDRLNRRLSVWQALTMGYLKQHPITAEDKQALIQYLDELAQKRAAQ